MATMKQAIKEAFEQSEGALSKEVIRQFVDERYPGIWQPSTLTAHLYACAINNPKSYIHHPHAGIVTLIVLGRKGPHGFPFRRSHSQFPIH